jgi:hypothetical protein
MVDGCVAWDLLLPLLSNTIYETGATSLERSATESSLVDFLLKEKIQRGPDSRNRSELTNFRPSRGNCRAQDVCAEFELQGQS